MKWKELRNFEIQECLTSVKQVFFSLSPEGSSVDTLAY